MNLLKKFNEYIDKVEESLDSPVEITWLNANKSYAGMFIVDDINYKIEYIQQIGNNFSYTFSIEKDGYWSYDISHSGTGGFKVLSTVKKGLYDIYDMTKPNSIIFSAIDDSETRKRLYQQFCEEFCRKKNWNFSNRGTDNKRLFLMFNEQISDSEKEEVMKSVQKIVEFGK